MDKISKAASVIKIGVGVLTLLIGVGAYVVFKPNLSPATAKQEVERILNNTQNTFKQATNAY